MCIRDRIVPGGVTLHVGPKRNDELVRRAFGQALLKLRHSQFLRADTIHRRDFAPEHMVVTTERTGFLNIQNINRSLDDADSSFITRRVSTNAAR